MGSLLQWRILLSAATFVHIASSTKFPSSCIGQEDGYQWIKPLDGGDEFPLIYQQCSNEYMIIDINEDPNVEKYFSSYAQWHYALSGLVLDHIVHSVYRGLIAASFNLF